MEEKHEFLKKHQGHGGSPMKETSHPEVHRESHGIAAEQEKHPREMELGKGEPSAQQPSGAPHMGEGHKTMEKPS